MKRTMTTTTVEKDNDGAEDDHHYHGHITHDADPSMTSRVLLGTDCHCVLVVLNTLLMTPDVIPPMQHKRNSNSSKTYASYIVHFVFGPYKS